VALATGMAWLAHGSDHGGSLRGPATLCSVVGLRPSPGRVTRGTSANLFSPLSVQGPMARNVPDLALFLDTMAGQCPLDPLTFDAPATPFAATIAAPLRRLRVAFTANYGGRVPVDGEMREICAREVRKFETAGCIVEEAYPELGPVEDVFLALRSQHFVVDRELQLKTHRELIKPDIIWNTEQGLNGTPSGLAWAERERAQLFRRFAVFFREWDVLVTPGAATPAWDVMLRARNEVDGVKLANYIAGSNLTSAITLTSCPAVSVPCGFDRHGRPVGLQIVAPARGEATALAAASLFERASGLDRLLPIDPRAGKVPA
jgi:amidase